VNDSDAENCGSPGSVGIGMNGSKNRTVKGIASASAL
jgi:hypothetical protein